jgi:hypothetical protein
LGDYVVDTPVLMELNGGERGRGIASAHSVCHIASEVMMQLDTHCCARVGWRCDDGDGGSEKLGG